MTNSLWVSKAVSSHFSDNKQDVSDIIHFVKDSLITSFPMTNSLWVISHVQCEYIISNTMAKESQQRCFIFPRIPTYDFNSILKGGEWFRPLCYRIFWTHCFVLQIVSNLASLVKGGFVTPMTNSMWATLHILWCGSLVTPFPMIKRVWVTLYMM